ncbi:ATP-binding protein [Streptomyces acidiscabies]|uniref:ATP-binding protein n=2 Tax=Streptomyces acidiscabies TaxID=42234 RepID=A0AAP6EKI2_9ACTN|nr:ATP-binding protein [Streptomyces acidiscabies]MBZ3915077.1 ATP-binding protein [Streptomyces acidiscabies]MDX2966302.1 ATP-binding protein [Streptomyces acidiscabies]MDX3021140.1 ATP-binding protein [Streptomyces acidiscabies]MDX3794803.1 ATP-binding protein [Streptomyces acidiscabies]
MDPNTREPEESGQDGRAQRPRSSRDPLAPGQHAPAPARTVDIVAGEHLLTVNPVDGSEIELCPPTERPDTPVRRTAEARAEAERAARPPVPAGHVPAPPPLLGRQEEREQLVRLVARGRSVRLTGPAGSGRTRLLDLVAEDCADLAPDGVVRLSGYGRGAEELLHELFHLVYDAPRHRPLHGELLVLVREIGAVVVVDDLEFGGAELDGLLAATPECAFVFGATGETPLPSAGSAVEEVTLGGLDRAGGIDLIERAVGRVLTEEEANWAGDLWFESEGLPLRFVQAGALLQQRDQVRASADAVDEYGVFEDARPVVAQDGEPEEEIPLPSLGEAAGPAPLLAARLSSSARATLRFAIALGGEVPHQAHLPALVGDTHADAALGELVSCGLVTPVGSRYRLAAGIKVQLEAAGYGGESGALAQGAAAHYAWWAGHPSVTPERVCAEGDAILAALSVASPLAVPPGEGEQSVAVQLARTAVPAFAAGLAFDAWERALRGGAEAARLSGEVADQAYFHHELGVYAILAGQLDRARSELETSIGLRGALADKRGTLAGRRALALVADRAGEVPGLPGVVASASAGAVVSAGGVGEAVSRSPEVGVTQKQRVVVPPAAPVGAQHRRSLRGIARRNLVAAGAGALLVAVLGTVVGLGATSDKGADGPSREVGPSASTGLDGGESGVGAPGGSGGSSSGSGGSGGGTGGVSDPTSRPSPTDPGPDGKMGTPDDPTPSESADGSTGGTAGGSTGGGTGSTSPTPTPPPTHSSPSPTPRPSDSPSPTVPASPSPTAPSSSPTAPESTPSTSTSASGPAASSPAVSPSTAGSASAAVI